MLNTLDATLVIGYGNDLRGDDGAGIRAATIIAAQSPHLRVIITPQLTPDLAEDIASATQVIFVDAYMACATGANLRIEEISGDDVDSANVMGHHGSPSDLLHLANQLFGRAPEAWLVGIPAYSFAAGESISSETLYWIDEAVALIGERAFSKK
ncbi:hydrogenase maturation protease [Propionivibrio sp.]|uniref:hydrogenase maturation protease n=1 Tax=Propionivibrio sp. TaxID=2212460 RepID=UPI002639D0CF|nr:hydrogenase maturation protease [Propionivibrio sp.]